MVNATRRSRSNSRRRCRRYHPCSEWAATPDRVVATAESGDIGDEIAWTRSDAHDAGIVGGAREARNVREGAERGIGEAARQ
jgi:hypothetical protein